MKKYNLVLKLHDDTEKVVKIDGENTLFELSDIDLFTTNYNNISDITHSLKQKCLISNEMNIKNIYIRYKFKERDHLKDYSYDNYKRLDVIYSDLLLMQDIVGQVAADNSLLNINENLKDLIVKFIDDIKNHDITLDILASDYISQSIKGVVIAYLSNDITYEDLEEKISFELQHYKSLRGLLLFFGKENMYSDKLYKIK